MSNDYSENSLVQESAGRLLKNELGWDVAFAHNTEKLGVDGSFGRCSMCTRTTAAWHELFHAWHVQDA